MATMEIPDTPAATDTDADTGADADRGTDTDGTASTAERALLERNEALTLINSGQATTATVDALRDTGARVNGRAVAELRLLVDRPGAEPYPVVRSAVLPEPDADLARATVASSGRPRRIPVLVDPRRPQTVLLRWDLRPAS